MIMNIKLIKADQNDIPVITSMMQEFYRLYDYSFNQRAVTNAIKELMKSKSQGIIWLIEQEGKVAGYLILTIGFSLEYYGRDAFIDEFFIKENFRNKGIGNYVLKAVDKEARKFDLKALHLEVERSNQAGKKLYLKNGFKGNNRALLTKTL